MQIIEKPWGKEEVLEIGEDYKIKKLYVEKGETSLQLHKKRRETMFILDGVCSIQVGDKLINNAVKGVNITIEPFMVHKISTDDKVVILEVQQGECDDDDIIRIEDKYDR